MRPVTQQLYTPNWIVRVYVIWRIHLGMYLARDPKQLGNIIRRARKRLGLSQKQLGEKTAMRQATISLLETGNAAARLENLLTVLAALELELQVTPRAKDWDKEMENYL
jgi:HTH-type transcriptional regulator/antitoxin HipB